MITSRYFFYLDPDTKTIIVSTRQQDNPLPGSLIFVGANVASMASEQDAPDFYFLASTYLYLRGYTELDGYTVKTWDEFLDGTKESSLERVSEPRTYFAEEVPQEPPPNPTKVSPS